MQYAIIYLESQRNHDCQQALKVQEPTTFLSLPRELRHKFLTMICLRFTTLFSADHFAKLRGLKWYCEAMEYKTQFLRRAKTMTQVDVLVMEDMEWVEGKWLRDYQVMYDEKFPPHLW
jgi:hypothetical protein